MADWTSDAADAIERSVALVRDRTIEPARKATLGLVFGTLAALIAIPAVVLLLIGFFRILVLCFQGEVWLAWMTLGGIFIAAGAFCWKQRTP